MKKSYKVCPMGIKQLQWERMWSTKQIWENDVQNKAHVWCLMEPKEAFQVWTKWQGLCKGSTSKLIPSFEFWHVY
jgi:hypothetical protein